MPSRMEMKFCWFRRLQAEADKRTIPDQALKTQHPPLRFAPLGMTSL